MKECKHKIYDNCLCSVVAYEPEDDCPVHGCGEWPPRCDLCGQFMKFEAAQELNLLYVNKEGRSEQGTDTYKAK